MNEVLGSSTASHPGVQRSLWVVEESLDPAQATSDHFAPGFSSVAPREVVELLGSKKDKTRPSVRADRALFFDLETTGFGVQARIFMSGCLWWAGSRMQLLQEVAADLAQERELLKALHGRIEERPCLVTYNGRSFDVPLLRRRLSFHRLPPLPGELEVIDLLHATRRRHGKSLPNCKLATVERELIGKHRTGRDIPGAEAPLRFEDYLATGNRAFIDPVLYHNRIDLTTLAALLPLVAAPPMETTDGAEKPADAAPETPF